jgi:hypothetical protein
MGLALNRSMLTGVAAVIGRRPEMSCTGLYASQSRVRHPRPVYEVQCSFAVPRTADVEP